MLFFFPVDCRGHALMAGQIAANGARRGRRWVLWSVAGALILSVALVIVVLAWLMFPDFDDAAPGSLAWYQLPGFVTAAPTPAACGEPRYGLHFLDGEKPQSATVRFQTRASPAELRAAYARVLAACRPDPGVPGGDRFQCDGRDYHTVILSLAPGEGCRQAGITFLSG
jgi:hypothetical protein